MSRSAAEGPRAQGPGPPGPFLGPGPPRGPERARGGFQGVPDGRGFHIRRSQPDPWPGDPVQAKFTVFPESGHPTFCCCRTRIVFWPHRTVLWPHRTVLWPHNTVLCGHTTLCCGHTHSPVWIPHRDSAGGAGRGGRFAESLEARDFTSTHTRPLSRAAGGTAT